MKLLMIDIETAPIQAYAWGLWDPRIAINQIVSPGYTLCFAAKWYGERNIQFHGLNTCDDKTMIQRAHKLLDEADAVCHFNGRKFDIPVLNKEFVRHHLKPPSPYKQIDLLQTCRRQFRFESNKLDYVSQYLGLGKKTSHKGMELWRACMDGDESAWRLMERYNRQDVRLLERLHDELRPWIRNYPNVNVFDAEPGCCPKCGSDRQQRRGYQITTTRRYARFQCRDCGAWYRSVACEPGRATYSEAA
jgi:DNA polymerase elongation subunit (family B)